jgi:hypothetical protein
LAVRGRESGGDPERESLTVLQPVLPTAKIGETSSVARGGLARMLDGRRSDGTGARPRPLVPADPDRAPLVP